ncbi:MAG: hypothetical protein MHM6MM_005571 [Cercozoa sp. M6MM]
MSARRRTRSEITPDIKPKIEEESEPKRRRIVDDKPTSVLPADMAAIARRIVKNTASEVGNLTAKQKSKRLMSKKAQTQEQSAQFRRDKLDLEEQMRLHRDILVTSSADSVKAASKRAVEAGLSGREALKAIQSADAIVHITSVADSLAERAINTQQESESLEVLVQAAKINTDGMNRGIYQDMHISPSELSGLLSTIFASDSEQAEDIDFVRFGEYVLSNFALSTPSPAFMLTPITVRCGLDTELAETATKKTRARKDDGRPRIKRTFGMSTQGAAERPREMDVSRQDKTHTTKRAKDLQELVKNQVGEQGTNLLTLVTNPDRERGFTQTVENLFDMSFLVRNNDAAIDIDQRNGQPIVKHVRRMPDEDQSNPRQCIVRYDFDSHNDIVRTFKLLRSRIPTRQPFQRGTDEDERYL